MYTQSINYRKITKKKNNIKIKFHQFVSIKENGRITQMGKELPFVLQTIGNSELSIILDNHGAKLFPNFIWFSNNLNALE